MGMDGLFQMLDSARQNLQDFLGLSATAHVRLRTADGAECLVADDASLVSLIDLRGSLRCIGDEEFGTVQERLVTILRTPLSRACHTLQFVMDYDPQSAAATIARRMGPTAKASRALGLDLDVVLNDWAGTISRYCADESMLLAVWTRPTILTRAELKRSRAEMAADRKAGKFPPVDRRTQTQALPMERMRSMHLAVVREINDALKALGYRCDVLDRHAAARTIRRCIAPNHTATDWRPNLPGDRLPMRQQAPGKPGHDLSHCFPPTLDRQLWPCETRVLDGKFVRIGDRVFATVMVTLPQQTVKPFNALFRQLILRIPWRGSVTLSGDGMAGSALKYNASKVLSFASAGNKQYNLAYEALEAAALLGECSVSLQMTFTTWVDAGEKDCLRRLAQRAALLRTSVQSWGSCDTTDLVGDPLLAFVATLPACTPNSPAPKAIAPLSDAVALLPLQRVCSPWEDATTVDLPLRTPDGRFMPVGLFHSSMASWNEIAFAGMGQGKSFFLNTLNFFFLLRSGQAHLPWLTIIDVGMSCSGVISLVRSALPQDQKHLAVFARLRNDRAAAINPFDTPLGCDRPLPAHRDFLVNLLALLCTPHSENVPADGVTGLLEEAVDTTYRRLGRSGEAQKRYDPYLDDAVREHLERTGFAADDGCTWWEVVNHLFGEGQVPLAILAQRHAVPVVSDISQSCNDPVVNGTFAKLLLRNGETVPASCVRQLTTAVKSYPILANPTRFALGAARVVGLDLQEVTPRSGPQAQRQAGIMYMLARYVGAAHFFNVKEDIALIPEMYRPWHAPRFASLAHDPKRLCYDEFHRASCADENNPLSRQIIGDLTTAARESRKHNISIGLYSQQLSDFPKVLVDLATSVYALGAGNAKEAAEISERFGFNHAAAASLRSINRPTEAGANFIGLFRTSHGESVLYLTNSAGTYAKWAFSTTAEDMRIRNRLYDVLGCRPALDVLVARYPRGSVKEELERRRGALEEHTAGERTTALEDTLVEELIEEARTMRARRESKGEERA